MAQDAKTPAEKGFNLQPAQSSGPQAQIQPPAPQPQTQALVVQEVQPLPKDAAPLSTNGAIVGFAAVFFLAGIFYFIRGAIRSHLISRRASPSAASSAAWALFAFLLFTSITVVFGALGNLWRVLPFILPLGMLSGVTLLLFAALYIAAAKGRR